MTISVERKSHYSMEELITTLCRAAPYFHVQRVRDQFVTRGLVTCSLGHKIACSPSQPPDGIFAEWCWDGQRLTVENDRYGMYPLFYFATESACCISSSIWPLLAEGAPTDIDWASLAVFLHLGFYIGDDTVFKAIRLLPPKAQLVWDGQVRVVGGYHFTKPQNIPRKAAIEGYIALFSAAMAKRTPAHDNFAVLLSGGRDSRHILLELCARGRSPQYCLTARDYPPDTGEDARVAALVAAALGVKHVVVGPPLSQVRSLFEANLLTNMTAPYRGWKLPLVDYLRKTVAVSYDGIGGDMLSAGAAIDRKSVQLLESGQLAEYCRYTFRGTDKALRRIVPREQYQRLSLEHAIAHLEVEVKRHLKAANPATSFNFWNRTRRFNATSPYSVFASIPTVYSPFLDHDLYALLSSLQANVVLDGTFHDDVIRTAYPTYRRLPYADPAAPLRYNTQYMLHTLRELTVYVCRHWPRHLVNPRFILPRLLADLASLGTRAAITWAIPIVVYLLQLELLTNKPDLFFPGL